MPTSAADSPVMPRPESASSTAVTGALTVTGPLGAAVAPTTTKRFVCHDAVRPSPVVSRAAACSAPLAVSSDAMGAVSGRSKARAEAETLSEGGDPAGVPAIVAVAR